MKRCTQCILPETYPEITFDDQGVCKYCRSFEPTQYKGEDALRGVLQAHPSQSEWDCLVPLSGGRDSTFTLYQLARKYNRRVLGYNYDNGFVEQVARDNISGLARRLGVDVIYRRSARDVQCRNIRHLTRMNIRKSPGHASAFLCSGCRNGIWGGAYAVAREKNIPLIIFGESSMESGTFKKIITPTFTPSLAEKLFFMVRMPVNFVQRRHVTRMLHREFPPAPADGEIRQINFFDYEEWNEKRILSVIQDNLDWKHKLGQSTWRFDCQIHALVNRMTYQLLGMTEKDELYSKLIREGQLSREEALERIQTRDQEKETELQIIDKVLDRMQLRKKEKEMILTFCQGPPRLRNSWQ